MGGSVFPGKTRRVSAEEYTALSATLNEYFAANGIKSEIVPSYTAKQSFGDIDVVVDNQHLLERIPADFGSPFKRNGNIVSFILDGCQVDLIGTPGKYFRSSVDYYSYNDLGNFLGRITRKLGIKYGFHGLHLIVKDGDQLVATIELACECKSTLYEMLGISHYINTVPETLEDIFQIVADSCYFDKEIFLLENRPRSSRVRDVERPNYIKFLEYIERVPSRYSFPDKTSKGGYNLTEPYYSELVLKYFDVSEQVNQAIQSHTERKQAAARIRSALHVPTLQHLTQLSGKEFSIFYSQFKEFVILEYLTDLVNNTISLETVYKMYCKHTQK